MPANLGSEKRAMDTAAAALKKQRGELNKVLDKARNLHGKLDPMSGRPVTPPDKKLKEWNKEMEKANKVLNEIAKAMQKLSNTTNSYHQTRIQQDAKANA
jgi:hypothetical protein